MNEQTEKFVNSLKSNSSVKSVILFGSQARGNARENSDVDLIIVCEETKRGVEKLDGQTFELVYVTETDAKEYYKNNKDNAVRTWNVAKILYDLDGSADRLKSFVKSIEVAGKSKISTNKLEHLAFDTEDFLRALEAEQPTKALYLLNLKLPSLLELYFDIRCIWKPAPKQLLDEIKSSNMELYNLISSFYTEQEITKKVEIFRKIQAVIFN